MLGVAVKLERRRIAERTARSRADAKPKGVKFGRKPTLTPHRQREAREQLVTVAKSSFGRCCSCGNAALARALHFRGCARCWSGPEATRDVGQAMAKEGEEARFAPTLRWREPDSNPRSRVSGSALFETMFTPCDRSGARYAANDRHLDIGIVENDKRRIASQFERQFLHRARPLFGA
jgi:hypothetical protein